VGCAGLVLEAVQKHTVTTRQWLAVWRRHTEGKARFAMAASALTAAETMALAEIAKVMIGKAWDASGSMQQLHTELLRLHAPEACAPRPRRVWLADGQRVAFNHQSYLTCAARSPAASAHALRAQRSCGQATAVLAITHDHRGESFRPA